MPLSMNHSPIAQLERGKRIVEVFKQPQYNPVPVEVQVAVLYAVQHGFMDSTAVDKIKDFQAKLVEYLQTWKRNVLDLIAARGQLNDEIAAALKDALKEFGRTFQ